MGGMAPEPLRSGTASVQIILCVALMLIAVGVSVKTEKTWIQGSVGKLAAAMTSSLVASITIYIWPGSEFHILHSADHGFSRNTLKI